MIEQAIHKKMAVHVKYLLSTKLYGWYYINTMLIANKLLCQKFQKRNRIIRVDSDTTTLVFIQLYKSLQKSLFKSKTFFASHSFS